MQADAALANLPALAVIGAEEVERRLPFPDLVDALDAGFRAGVTSPKRHHHALRPAEAGRPPATLLLMPAWTVPGPGAARAYAGVKIVTVVPENDARGLSSVLGTYLLLDGESGAALAAIDGTRLTLRRTAAASALAARYLAHPHANRMVMVGAGALAPNLIRAHAAVRPLTHVAIWNHRPERAQALAARLAFELGGALAIEALSADGLEAAVREADIVSCATLSTAPLVRGAWLKAGAHLDLVGAFAPGMREADDEALARASLFVDTDAALTEGGDVAGALASGALQREAVLGTLFDLAAGRHAGRSALPEGATTAFKSVGSAIEDLIAARLVHERGDPAAARGIAASGA